MVFVDGDSEPYISALPAVARRLNQPAPRDVSIHAGFNVSSLGEHRQHALEVACSKAQYDAGLKSTWITWMDDDDWRHPEAVKQAFQRSKETAYDDEVKLVIPKCGCSVLINTANGRWAEIPKQIHWYETLIRADLAMELEPFMPGNISEDYYWHQNAVSLAKSYGPTATYELTFTGGYSGANLYHGANTACKDFDNIWKAAPTWGWGTSVVEISKQFPAQAFLTLCGRIASAHNPTKS
jgi:hypothetical protein